MDIYDEREAVVVPPCTLVFKRLTRDLGQRVGEFESLLLQIYERKEEIVSQDLARILVELNRLRDQAVWSGELSRICADVIARNDLSELTATRDALLSHMAAGKAAHVSETTQPMSTNQTKQH